MHVRRWESDPSGMCKGALASVGELRERHVADGMRMGMEVRFWLTEQDEVAGHGNQATDNGSRATV